MKKLMFIIAVLFSVAASAQQKDSTQKQPETYLLAGSKEGFEKLKAVLIESPGLTFQGKPMSAKEIIELLQWATSYFPYDPKPQPKPPAQEVPKK